MSESDVTPVVVVTGSGLGGIISWTLRLKKAFAGHPRYRVLLLEIGPQEVPCSEFDLHAAGIEETYDVLKELPPAIVIPNFCFALYAVCAKLIADGRRITVVGICHSDHEEEYHRPLGSCEQVIGGFVAVSRECAEHLAGHIPARRAADITILPYGVDVPPRLDRRYQTQPIRLVYAGRVVQLQKRVMDFVPLVERLLARRVDFRLDIVGDGPALDALKAEIASRPHEGRVQFQPRVPPERMGEVWEAHDVFVQLSDFEGTSVSMLEAMAHGTAPIITDPGSGVEGVVIHGRNGFILPVGDMDAVAGRIADMAADPAGLERMGRAAHQRARDFSMESYTEKFARVLDRVQEGPLRTWTPLHPQSVLLNRCRELAGERDYHKAVAERYRYSFEYIMNKWPVRLYRALRDWLAARLGRKRPGGKAP